MSCISAIPPPGYNNARLSGLWGTDKIQFMKF